MLAYSSLRGKQPIRDETLTLDPIAIGLLKRVCDATDAQIVVSSTWRLQYSVPEFQAIFNHYGWPDAPVIGVTGRGGINSVRGDEIQQWLDSHPNCTNYVIIDDDSDMLQSQLPHCVFTDGANGFTLGNMCQALHILGAPDKDAEAHAFFTTEKPY